jgi:hypothetical protein
MIFMASSLSRALFGQFPRSEELTVPTTTAASKRRPPQAKTPPSKTPLYSPRKIAIEFGRKQGLGAFARAAAEGNVRGREATDRPYRG